MKTIENILTTLGITPNAQRIYIELMTNGETTPRLLAGRLSMSRPSVYDQIKYLSLHGLVVIRDLENKTFVAPADIQILSRMLKEKRDQIDNEEKELALIADSLKNQTRTTAPRIKFFEGKEALQQALHDILWSSKTDMVALWPYEEMLVMLGKEFLVSFNEKRIRQKIALKTLWVGKQKAVKNIWEDNDTGIERRYLPHADVGMGYTIYEDKVIFISSKKECFGFIISSHDFATMMRFQFEALWTSAKKA
jgi:HTH-type transcriptional regulator, sugar sensing transcriptional regulator